MRIEAGTQLSNARLPRRFAGGHGDVDRRQGVLIQPKGLSCETFDAIARHGGAEDARRDG